MNANPEFGSFVRLVQSLAPWLEQVVIIGGWAHRLHRFHPFAQALDYEPLVTFDADVALPNRLRVRGAAIYQRLAANGFQAELLGHHRPPATHYRLADPGIRFYAEFLTQRRKSVASHRKICDTSRFYCRHRGVSLCRRSAVFLSPLRPSFPSPIQSASLLKNF